VRLVAEVSAGFQQRTHREFRQSHDRCILFPIKPSVSE